MKSIWSGCVFKGLLICKMDELQIMGLKYIHVKFFTAKKSQKKLVWSKTR